MSRNIQYRIEKVKYEELPVVKSLNEMLLPENYPMYFYENLFQNFGEAFLVAKVDDEIVGYIMCRVEKEFKFEFPLRFRKVGHIVSIAIKPNYRRLGIGTSLMKIAMENLRRIYEVEYVYLEVRVSNTPAIKFYEKLGFKISRTVEGYYRDGESAYIMVYNFIDNNDRPD